MVSGPPASKTAQSLAAALNSMSRVRHCRLTVKGGVTPKEREARRSRSAVSPHTSERTTRAAARGRVLGADSRAAGGPSTSVVIVAALVEAHFQLWCSRWRRCGEAKAPARRGEAKAAGVRDEAKVEAEPATTS
jgi:hypothetical protein